MSEPGLSLHQNALLLPASAGGARAMGAYDAEGGFLAASACPLKPPGARLLRNGSAPLAPPPVAEARLEGPVLYGGLILEQFGHALLETLARLWALEEAEAQDARIAFFAYPSLRGPLFDRLMALAGLGERVVVIDRPTAVDQLILPDPAVVIRHQVHPLAGRIFERIRAGAGRAVERCGAPLYVSRSGLSPLHRQIMGERLIERFMASAGAEIFHPQEHDLAVQILRLDAAPAAVGYEGSAFHLSVFAAPGLDLHYVHGHAMRPNYALLDAMKGHAGHPLANPVDGVIPGFEYFTFWDEPVMPDLPALFAALKARGFKGEARFGKRKIARLLTEFRSIWGLKTVSRINQHNAWDGEAHSELTEKRLANLAAIDRAIAAHGGG
jgi:hypothetical protein